MHASDMSLSAHRVPLHRLHTDEPTAHSHMHSRNMSRPASVCWPVHTDEHPHFTPRSLPSHVPGAAHTADMYRAQEPHAPPGGTAEPCAGQWGHSGLHTPHKPGVEQDLAGQAGHLPSATWGDTVSTPAQVDVSFSLSLELLSYQTLPADQMLPGVDIQQSENGEKQMVFTGNLLLSFTNQTFQACARHRDLGYA